MKQIEDLTEKIAPLSVDSPLTEVLNYFRENKDAIIVPVVTREGIPVGVLRERDFKSYVYSPYGKEVLLNKSIKKSIDEFMVSCSICDIDTNIESILQLFNAEENKDGVIIVRDGGYFGFLSAFSILRILSEKKAEEKFSSTIDSLVVGIAHEINTPLGISITASSYMIEKLKELLMSVVEKRAKKSEMEEELNRLVEATNSIVTNLDRVSNLTSLLKKVSVNRHFEENRRFRVIDAANAAKDSVELKCGKIRHQIEINCDEQLVISTLYELFTEVVANILENAIEHAFDDDKKGRVKLSFVRRGDYLDFICEDNGKGIPEELQEKIFEPFFTTMRNKGKLGLGLNIVQNILQHKLHGIIAWECRKDKGCRFIVSFPFK